MEGPGLFACSVLVYSALPLLYVARRTSFQFLLLYTHLASLLTFGFLLGSVYALPLLGDVEVTAGQVAYCGFLFGAIVTTVVGRDVQVVRNIIALTLVVNALVLSVFTISRLALAEPSIPNLPGASPELFTGSLGTVLVGGALVVLELLLLVGVLEVSKKRLPSWAMAGVYPLAYVAVLALDGAVFPALVLRPESGLADMVADGVVAKLVLAAAFAVPLLVFVAFYRRALSRYEASPLSFRHLAGLSHDELLSELDNQALLLAEQRDRIVDSTASFGRASATVERILGLATGAVLFALDKDSRFTHVSAGAQEILGYTVEEVLGQSPEMFHTQAEVARHAGALGVAPDMQVVAAEQIRLGTARDWEFLGKDGSRRVISMRITEVVVDGEVVGFVAAGEDVTSRVRAEAAMMSALNREHDALVRLQQADRVKDELVSTVSHELRTPIASINGYTEMLFDGAYGVLTEKQSEALDRVARNTQRLEALVDDLLVLERVEFAPLPLQRVPLDLSEVIRGTSEIVAEMVRGRELKFSVSLPANPVIVDGDRDALERMVLNLISNAVKFTPGRGTIALRVTSDRTQACLSVADTGIGIGEDEQPQLFTRFFRTRQANELAIPGSGLGLSIVQAVVHGHDGDVRLTSTPEVGTTVTVTLPLASAIAVNTVVAERTA